MGANPYRYIVSYRPRPDVLFPEFREPEFCIRAAFDDLRCWLYASGHYQPLDSSPEALDRSGSPITGLDLPAIREGLARIKEGLEDSNDGTRSLLDLDRIAEAPGDNAVGPLADETLTRLYGTTKPTREMVLEGEEFLSEIGRGQGLYIVLFKDGQPDEILFAGYSFN